MNFAASETDKNGFFINLYIFYETIQNLYIFVKLIHKQKLLVFQRGVFVERVKGVEPLSRVWKTRIITAIRYPQMTCEQLLLGTGIV